MREMRECGKQPVSPARGSDGAAGGGGVIFCARAQQCQQQAERTRQQRCRERGAHLRELLARECIQQHSASSSQPQSQPESPYDKSILAALLICSCQTRRDLGLMRKGKRWERASFMKTVPGNCT